MNEWTISQGVEQSAYDFPKPPNINTFETPSGVPEQMPEFLPQIYEQWAESPTHIPPPGGMNLQALLSNHKSAVLTVTAALFLLALMKQRR